MDFVPINGQSVSACSNLRLGWCRLKTNGCAVVAIYNALGFLGLAMPLEKILRSFRAWYRPHLFGISPRRIRAFFRQRDIAFCFDNEHWNDGDIAVVTYWNRRFFGKFVNPFGGAHTVCVRYSDGFWVYNRFSNRSKTYRYDSLEMLLSDKKVMQILKISKEDL